MFGNSNMVQGFGFRFRASGLGVQGSEFRASGLGVEASGRSEGMKIVLTSGQWHLFGFIGTVFWALRHQGDNVSALICRRAWL